MGNNNGVGKRPLLHLSGYVITRFYFVRSFKALQELCNPVVTVLYIYIYIYYMVVSVTLVFMLYTFIRKYLLVIIINHLYVHVVVFWLVNTSSNNNKTNHDM